MTNKLVDASRMAITFEIRYTTLRIARKSMTNGEFATSVTELGTRDPKTALRHW